MQSQYSGLEQRNFYLSVFTQLGFTDDQIRGFFIQDPSLNLSFFIYANLNFLKERGFTLQNIVDIAQFGGFQVFNHLMLYLNPLLSFDYTPEMLVNIAKSAEFLINRIEVMSSTKKDEEAFLNADHLTDDGRNIFGF